MSVKQGMKFYVAGPMTGHVLSNWPEFFRVAKALREAGFEVENPAEVDIINGVNPCEAPGGEDRESVLLDDFERLLRCDGVVLLQAWEDSEGARAEVHLAELTGKPVYRIRLHGKSLPQDLIGLDATQGVYSGEGFDLIWIKTGVTTVVSE